MVTCTPAINLRNMFLPRSCTSCLPPPPRSLLLLSPRRCYGSRGGGSFVDWFFLSTRRIGDAIKYKDKGRLLVIYLFYKLNDRGLIESDSAWNNLYRNIVVFEYSPCACVFCSLKKVYIYIIIIITDRSLENFLFKGYFAENWISKPFVKFLTRPFYLLNYNWILYIKKEGVKKGKKVC